jgi:hypothetical protein
MGKLPENPVDVFLNALPVPAR